MSKLGKPTDEDMIAVYLEKKSVNKAVDALAYRGLGKTNYKSLIKVLKKNNIKMQPSGRSKQAFGGQHFGKG